MNDTLDVSNTISANAELLIGSYKLKLNLVMPTDEVPPESLMPTLRELCNQVADGVVQIVQENQAAGAHELGTASEAGIRH